MLFLWVLSPYRGYLRLVDETHNSPISAPVDIPRSRDPSLRPHARQRTAREVSRSPSYSSHRSPSIITLGLEDEERRKDDLKSFVQSTADRLEYILHHSNKQVEVKVEDELTSTSLDSLNAANCDILELTRQHEEIETSQRLQIERMGQDIERLKKDIARLQEQKTKAEEVAEAAMQASREAHTALVSYRAREEGRQEGLQLGMIKRFHEEQQAIWDAGYTEGLESGRQEGFREGVKSGRNEGLRDGRAQGQDTERKRSVKAFDRFVAEEMDEVDETVSAPQNVCPNIVSYLDFMQRSQWTRRWAESVYHQTSPALGARTNSLERSIKNRYNYER